VSGDIGIRVEGIAELTRTMRKAGKDLSELKDAHTKAAQMVADRAAELAPRRSGALAGTIRPAKQANRARVMAGSAKVKYAAPIHWGWPARNIGSQPFLTDAATETESAWVEQYFRDVQAALDDVKGA
jgi:hypothetical protein